MITDPPWGVGFDEYDDLNLIDRIERVIYGDYELLQLLQLESNR